MVTVLTLQPRFCLYLLGNPLAAVRFEKSWGEICLGPVTNNEVTSARLLSDLWLACVAWGLLLPGGQREARAEAITMIVCSHNFLHFSFKYPEVDRLSFFFSFFFFFFFFFFLGKRLLSLEVYLSRKKAWTSYTTNTRSTSEKPFSVPCLVKRQRL